MNSSSDAGSKPFSMSLPQGYKAYGGNTTAHQTRIVAERVRHRSREVEVELVGVALLDDRVREVRTRRCGRHAARRCGSVCMLVR